MSLAVLFFNMALDEEVQSRERLLAEVMTKSMAFNEEQDREEFRALAETMVERHRQMFPEMHRGGLDGST